MITDTINQIKSMVNQFGSTGDMPSAVCQALDNNLNNIQSIYEFGKPNVITQHLTKQNECPVCQRSFQEFSGIKSQIVSFNEETNNAFQADLGKMFNMVNSLEETVLFNQPKQVIIAPSPTRCSGCGRNY